MSPPPCLLHCMQAAQKQVSALRSTLDGELEQLHAQLAQERSKAQAAEQGRLAAEQAQAAAREALRRSRHTDMLITVAATALVFLASVCIFRFYSF